MRVSVRYCQRHHGIISSDLRRWCRVHDREVRFDACSSATLVA
jgi:hypothetical protein